MWGFSRDPKMLQGIDLAHGLPPTQGGQLTLSLAVSSALSSSLLPNLTQPLSFVPIIKPIICGLSTYPVTLRLSIPSSGTRDCGEHETSSLSHRMQAGGPRARDVARGLQSRGRGFWRRGKALRFESVSGDIRCTWETWRQTSWGDAR